MRTRLYKNMILMAVVPLTSIILSSTFRNVYTAQIVIVIAAVILQTIVILVSKRGLRRLIKPSYQLMECLGIERVAVAYEPGKYRTDFRVASVCVWLSTLAPVFAFFANRFTHKVSVPIVNFQTFVQPNFSMLFTALTLVLIGSVALGLWVKFGQAMVISNEGAERKRYLFMGFFEKIDEEKQLYKTYMRQK